MDWMPTKAISLWWKVQTQKIKRVVLSKIVYIKTLSKATAPEAVSGITTTANNKQITVEWDTPKTAQQRGKDHQGAEAIIEAYTIYYRAKHLWNDATNEAQNADDLTITQAEITALKTSPNAPTDITKTYYFQG